MNITMVVGVGGAPIQISIGRGLFNFPFSFVINKPYLRRVSRIFYPVILSKGHLKKKRKDGKKQKKGKKEISMEELICLLIIFGRVALFVVPYGSLDITRKSNHL